MATEADIYKKFLSKTNDPDKAAELTASYLESKKAPAPEVTAETPKPAARIGVRHAAAVTRAPTATLEPERPVTVAERFVTVAPAAPATSVPATEKISRLEYAGRKYNEIDAAMGEPVRAAARAIQASGPALKEAAAVDPEAVDDALVKNQREIDARNAGHPVLGRLGAWLLDPEVEVPYTPPDRPIAQAYVSGPPKATPTPKTYGPAPEPPARPLTPPEMQAALAAKGIVLPDGSDADDVIETYKVARHAGKL